jgi:hypothetical protein
MGAERHPSAVPCEGDISHLNDTQTKNINNMDMNFVPFPQINLGFCTY